MEKRKETFLKEMIPLLERLNQQWTSPGALSPSGHNYACLYCDMNCSRHDQHDEDCFTDRARRVFEAFKVIENDSELLYDYKGQKRDEESYLDLVKYRKVRIILDVFFKDIHHFIPFDYTADNVGVICTCATFEDDLTHHQEDCIFQALSKTISKLLRPS